jgi:hypothetical protein|tara:strand:+ start:1736 stop:2434 length:699 start_codon:yes stop_codon:yes gene_type:complete
MRHFKTFENFVGEGRSAYDGLASKLVKATFNKWVHGYSGGNAVINFSEQIEERGLEFDLDATIHIDKKFKGFEVLGSTGADGRDEDDEGDFQTPFINIDFGINPDWIPGEWSTVYFNLADVIRHEMEHITQEGKDHGNYRAGKPDTDDAELRAYIKMGLLPDSQYLMLPKEVDANLQGLRYEAKKRKEPMADAVNRYLDTKEEGGQIDGKEREEVLTLWRRRAKKIGGIPKF